MKRILSALAIIAFLAIIIRYGRETTASEMEQQYIVRYGTTYNWGSIIVTEDGNEWALTDAPEYTNGTEVRVLFDSNKTQIVTDDIIIDVTERR